MSNKKFYAAFVEFYLTNHCNFGCLHCDSISNYNLAGGQFSWHDYSETYERWAEIIDFENIALHGGEPLMNPDYPNYIKGIRQLWPNTNLVLQTNGSLIPKQGQVLYELCREHDVNVFLNIHNPHDVDTLARVRSWLQGPITESKVEKNDFTLCQSEHQLRNDQLLQHCIMQYAIIKDPSWPQCRSLSQWIDLPAGIKQECVEQHNFTFEICAPKTYLRLTDANSVKVTVNNAWEHQINIIRTHGDRFIFNQNLAQDAHAVCHQKLAHQFYKGKLYKCSLTHVFSDVIDQFETNLDQTDIDLIKRYRPAEISWDHHDIGVFLTNLSNHVEQCKFCPDKPTTETIYASQTKPVVLHRKKNRDRDLIS
jgi:organic radical activating enzyme